MWMFLSIQDGALTGGYEKRRLRGGDESISEAPHRVAKKVFANFKIKGTSSTTPPPPPPLGGGAAEDYGREVFIECG